MSGIEFLDEVADRPADQTARAIAALVVARWPRAGPGDHLGPHPSGRARPIDARGRAHPCPASYRNAPAPEEDLCRQEPNCARTTVVPLVLREVINRYVPRRGSITVQSYLTKSIFDGATYLVARRIDVVAGPATVGILILRDVQANRRPLPPLTTPYGVASILVRGDPFGYVVSLQYLGPLNAVAVGGAAARARGRARAGVESGLKTIIPDGRRCWRRASAPATC